MYSQVLICVSFVAASIQDIRDRSVSDIVWIPALLGAGYAIFSLYPAVQYLGVKIGLVGAIALAFTLLGHIGQADGIAFAFVAADPLPLSPIPPLLAASSVALAHIAYEYAFGNARGTKTLPVDQFLREQRWIPKAVIKDGTRRELDRDVNVARDQVTDQPTAGSMVEVTYGVPTVAYLGLGYLVYLIYLLAFAPAVFFSLP